MLSQDRLKEVVSYDPGSGEFRHIRASGSKSAGAIAGTLSRHNGYVFIGVDGVQHRAHRLAWLYMTGDWPEMDIDHIDLVKSNNAWANLRLATRAQNIANSGLRKNNTTGFKGVFKARGKFAAKITVDYKSIHIGNFDTKEEASAAYLRAAQERFGEFARF